MITIHAFDRKLFLKVLLLSVLLNISWGFIATQIELLRDRDRGLIPISGYLAMYSLTFFLCFDKQKRTVYEFIKIVAQFSATFLISSFILLPLMSAIDHSFNTTFIATTINTLFSAVLILLIVSLTIEIKFKVLTGIAIFVVALLTTLLLPRLLSDRDYYDSIGFQSLCIIFSTWQILTSICLGLGMAIK